MTDSTTHAVSPCPRLSPFWQHSLDIALAWIPSLGAEMMPTATAIEYIHGWPTTTGQLRLNPDRLRLQLVFMASLTALYTTRVKMGTSFDPKQAQASVVSELLTLREGPNSSIGKLFSALPFNTVTATDIRVLVGAAAIFGIAATAHTHGSRQTIAT